MAIKGSVDALELRQPRGGVDEYVSRARERWSGPAGDILGEGAGTAEHHVHKLHARRVPSLDVAAQVEIDSRV